MEVRILSLVSILLILVACADFVEIYTQKWERLLRSKRQDSPWVWGITETTTTDNTFPTGVRIQMLPKSTRSSEVNPCKAPKPVMPDFTKRGLRVSEEKCFEYIWQIKKRDEEDKIFEACLEYRLKHPDPNEPHYAIGGRNTEPGEFPHMGAIGWKAFIGTWVFKCGSSLISPKFVLTAAHCSKASPRDTSVSDLVPKIVRLGDKNIADVWYNGAVPEDVNISRIIVHPKYASPKKYYDIALFELADEVFFGKYIQPACLWNKPDTITLGSNATLTGWGVVESAGLTTSPELQAAVVDIIDSSLCDELLSPFCNRLWCGVQETQICAGILAGGVDACKGDSGGPLQVEIPLPIKTQGQLHYVIGITSFGIGCARPNTPGLYTRVSAFVDWIESIVWK